MWRPCRENSALGFSASSFCWINERLLPFSVHKPLSTKCQLRSAEVNWMLYCSPRSWCRHEQTCSCMGRVSISTSVVTLLTHLYLPGSHKKQICEPLTSQSVDLVFPWVPPTAACYWGAIESLASSFISYNKYIKMDLATSLVFGLYCTVCIRSAQCDGPLPWLGLLYVFPCLSFHVVLQVPDRRVN